MGESRRLVKKVLENITGWKIERFGSKSFALIDNKNRTDAWFSHYTQIRSTIEKSKIDLVIDVGANEGQFTRELRAFYSGEIISFEPVSSVFEKLAIAASSDPKWHVYKLALGSEDSTQMINVSNSTTFSSLLKSNDYCEKHFGGKALITNKEIVSVRRLDNLMDEITPDVDGKRIFLKLDTQGYDSEVFKGAGNKLKNIRLLQSEVSLIPIYEGMPHWTESISAYENAGFGIVGMFPVSHDSGRVVEFDCLLTRVDP